MSLSNKRRENFAGAVSLALGLTVAALLKVTLLSPPAAPSAAKGTVLATPKAVRVRANSAKLPALPAVKAPSASVQPAKQRIAVREVAIQATTAPAERPVPVNPPQIEVAPSLPLVQPALSPAVAAVVAEMPPLPSAGAQSVPVDIPSKQPESNSAAVGVPMGRPDAPPDDYMPPPKTFVEQPGGDVMVLGLLLDSKGRALDVQILVPSYNIAGDTTYAMAVLQNQTFTDIEPPIPPGESRWIETRIYYPKRNILP